MSTQVTLRGRLTRHPELTYAKSGTAVARFAVVTSRNVKDRDTGEWTETGTSFWDCVAFGQFAENIAESLEKGMSVIVQGQAAQEEWVTKEGEKRKTIKVTCDDVAPSLRWASARVKRAERNADRVPAAAGASTSSAEFGGEFPPEPPF